MKIPRSFNSGAFRFALLIAALFAVGSILILFVVERSIRTYASEATATGLRSETAVLVRELPDGGEMELIDTITRRQGTVTEQPFRYLLATTDGKRLVGDLPLSAARIGWGEVSFLDDHPPPGEEGSPEVLQTLGTALPNHRILVVATDTFDIQKLRRRLDNFTIWSGIAITLLALIGGYFVGGLFLRRLERVNDAVGRIMAGSLSERLPPIGMAPELDDLGRNLNLMLDRIGDLVEGVQQVSTDIAHDLRTPLTRLQHQLETMQDATSIGDMRVGLETALAQTESILSVFRALLRISVIEAGEAKQLFVPFDLSDVAARMAEFYRPTAEDEFKAIRVSVQPSRLVLGDPEMLAQLFANLIDNALKYTPAGTTITVSVHSNDGPVVATVSDDGPGIPADERDKVLRRFYRLDASRHAPGVGLGLSLVQAIVKLHDGKMTILSNDPGVCVELTFPKVAQ